MRRIIVIVLMVIMVIGFEKQNLIYGSETTKNNIFDEEESTIAKYAESFLSKVYPDLTLKIVKSQKIYNRNDELNGYCYDIENHGVDYGYIIVSRMGDMIQVSEYAVQENISNPFEKVYSLAKKQNSNLKYYSENPFDFCVLDVDEDTAYEYNNGYKIINNYSDEVYLDKKNEPITANKEQELLRSLDGFSVISDSYAGTVTSSNMIPYANSIGFYERSFVTYIGADYSCGVSAGCNIMKYYRCIGYTNIPYSFSVLYNALWNLMSPDSNYTVNSAVAVQKIRDSINYFGYNCSYTPFIVNLYYDYKFAIDYGSPIYIAYETWFGNEYSGHAVVAVGYTQTTQNKYLKVADGWNTYLRYLTFDGYDYDVFCGYAFTVTP